MQRLITLGAAYALTLALLLAVAGACFFDTAREAGSAALLDRLEMQRQLYNTTAHSGEFVAWIGDSTLISTKEIPAYPDLIDVAPSWVVRVQGMDPYGYYIASGKLLERNPRLLILIANLRLLGSAHPRDFLTAADAIPTAELPHAMLLPWYGRGITLPRLLLSRTLAFNSVREFVRLTDGLRRTYQEADFWKALDLQAPGDGKDLARFFLGARQMIESYDQPLSARTPGIQMMRATVRRAIAAGVPTLVIVPPIPFERLTTERGFELGRCQARIDNIRAVVEAAGASFLDLHLFLADAYFQDWAGHPNKPGHEFLAQRVAPEILRLARPLTPSAKP